VKRQVRYKKKEIMSQFKREHSAGASSFFYFNRCCFLKKEGEKTWLQTQSERARARASSPFGTREKIIDFFFFERFFFSRMFQFQKRMKRVPFENIRES